MVWCESFLGLGTYDKVKADSALAQWFYKKGPVTIYKTVTKNNQKWQILSREKTSLLNILQFSFS